MLIAAALNVPLSRALNESPSEKEGKCNPVPDRLHNILPSMKVPPKRKGNLVERVSGSFDKVPQ